MSVLVIETAAGEPAPAQTAAAPRAIRVRLVADQPGIRVVRDTHGTITLLGHLAQHTDLYFNPLDDVSDEPNVVSEALADIFRARGVRHVVFDEPALWATVRKAAAGMVLCCWHGRHEMRVAGTRPVWRELPCAPGDRWVQAAALLGSA